jgi:glutamate dehydrogenase/leucine dehydrogenase
MEPESLHLRREAGVEMIIAIDSTVRGPALGGCRWRLYPDRAAARREACQLAAAMTRKAAMARLSLGGGKAVVIGDPRVRTPEQLLAFGAFVESLAGRYITAADMGTGENEMRIIAEATPHVIGLPRSAGGCGDPSPFTALGVRIAIEAALRVLQQPLRGASVLVQGVGAVGRELVRLLLEAEARVLACDCAEQAMAGLPAEVQRVSPTDATSTPCDVFAPCGPARVIDARVAASIPCRVVCGAANNPLDGLAAAAQLAGRGVLYAPDFVANAGGLIHLATAREGGDDARSRERLRVIAENLDSVLSYAKENDIEPAEAAERLAMSRLSERSG